MSESDFKSYRSVRATPIHLGGTEPPEYINPKEVVLWDGSQVQRKSGAAIKLNNPTSFAAVIRAGWVVLVESEVQSFRPKSAGVEVRQAAPRGTDRERVNLDMIQDEERDVGHIGDVRDEANEDEVLDVHLANDTSRTSPRKATEGRMQIQREGGDDGVVVGRLKNPAKAGSVDLGKGEDTQIKAKIESSKGVEIVKRRARATGDVQEARSGSELSELLPDAASSPSFENTGVQVSSGGSSIGSQEDGEVVSKVGEARKKTPPPTDVEEAFRTFAETGKMWPGAEPNHFRPMLRTFLRKYDAAVAQAAFVAKVDPTTEADELEPSPLNWDITTHWKSREKLVLAMDDIEDLRELLNIENSAGVLKAINRRIEELEG